MNIEVQQCDKKKSNNNNKVQGNGLEIKDDTEDQNQKYKLKKTRAIKITRNDDAKIQKQ